MSEVDTHIDETGRELAKGSRPPPPARDRLGNTLPTPSPASSRKRLWYAASAAAAAVLLVGIFFALRPAPVVPAPAIRPVQAPPQQAEGPKPEQRIEVAKLDPPVELAPEQVSGDHPSSGQLAPAFEAYGEDHYALAAERFRLLAKRFPRADVPLLYLGVSQLMMQDNKAALTSLARADQFATKTRKDAASWYHAVAAVQAHGPDATALLHDLCRRNKSHYALQACDLEKNR